METPSQGKIMTAAKAWLNTRVGKIVMVAAALGFVYWGFGIPSDVDIRILTGDPIDFVLAEEDFPDDFLLPQGLSIPNLNSDVVEVRGPEDGEAYIEATGRLSGWLRLHIRNDPTAIAPEEIRSSVVMYDNVQGPRLAVSPEWDFSQAGFEEINLDVDLGEWAQVTFRRDVQDDGRTRIWYQIQFIYHNILASVMGWDWESDVNHDYLENLARVMLSKMEAAPLARP